MAAAAAAAPALAEGAPLGEAAGQEAERRRRRRRGRGRGAERQPGEAPRAGEAMSVSTEVVAPAMTSVVLHEEPAATRGAETVTLPPGEPAPEVLEAVAAEAVTPAAVEEREAMPTPAPAAGGAGPEAGPRAAKAPEPAPAAVASADLEAVLRDSGLVMVQTRPDRVAATPEPVAEAPAPRVRRERRPPPADLGAPLVQVETRK
ncbi:MAG: hypothetical protein N2544_13710 [Burkholderiales bacterium]|nr:hypothetical protein [Burkholderiales bacterium]